MINTVTLNPAIDKVFFIDEFRRNITNRIKNSIDTIGGKGTHVSINLKLFGLGSRAFGLCHGENGRRIMAMLAEHDVTVRFVHRQEGNSRTNYLVVENSSDSTLITEKGMPFTEDDFADLLILMKKEMNSGDYLVLSGDASNADPSVLGRLIRELEEKKPKVFLDTSGAALKECAGLGPFLLKPNLDELSFLCGRTVTNKSDDVIDAVTSLAHYNINVIAVSLGGDGSILCANKEIYRAVPPLVKAINTVGCGDCYLSGLLFGITNELPFEETLKIATAASAAKAESHLTAGFDPDRYKSLAVQVKVQKIG